MKKLLSVVFLFSLIVSFTSVTPNINATQIPEGAIIKTEHNPDVYIIKYKNGKQFKRLILNPQVFESYGHLRWEDILTVGQSEMDSFATSNLVRIDGQTDIYQLAPNGDIGNKHLLVSIDGYDLDSAYTINLVDFGNYVMGEVKGTIPRSPAITDLPVIVQQWRAKIASVECDFRFSDTNEMYAQFRGSGILWAPTGSLILFTNKHVVTDDLGYAPHLCKIGVPGYTSTFIIYKADMKFSSNHDFVAAQIKNPDNDSWQIVYNATRPSCSRRAQIGEKIVILGYPAIGAVEGITATEGIISGYDGDYYITSAKVEQGASGGAAVLLNDNCLLGISTFAQVGQIESLARILDINVIYESSGLVE